MELSTQRPRITAKLTLAADTVLSLQAAIVAALSTAAAIRDLFADAVVADQAARLALTNVPVGYTVYQTDTTTFYRLASAAPAVNGSWTALPAATKVQAYQTFIKSLSRSIALDSYIGNATGGGDLVYMSSFHDHYAGAVPTSTIIGAYGVAIAAGTERSYSGSSDQVYLYSAAGTTLILDLIFNAGAI